MANSVVGPAASFAIHHTQISSLAKPVKAFFRKWYQRYDKYLRRPVLAFFRMPGAKGFWDSAYCLFDYRRYGYY